MGERGSVSVVGAAILVMAASMAVLLGDVGATARARLRAQAAADAAALAAAQELLLPMADSPRTAAEELARRNGARVVMCRCEPGASDVQVEVAMDGSGRDVGAVARAVVDAPGATAGMQPWFAARVGCLLERVPGTTILSGFRSRAQQAALHRRRPDLAAPPGRSMHERGLAADLSFPSAALRHRAHAVADACGLGFPVAHEPWHAEPLRPFPGTATP
jgi:secretion/DNA translocation related TadE-like protein